jgi:hypothetical protein
MCRFVGDQSMVQLPTISGCMALQLMLCGIAFFRDKEEDLGCHAPEVYMWTAACSACGRPISVDAQFCPHCGDTYPHQKRAARARAETIWGLILISGCCLFIFIALQYQTHSAPPSSTAPTVPVIGPEKAVDNAAIPVEPQPELDSGSQANEEKALAPGELKPVLAPLDTGRSTPDGKANYIAEKSNADLSTSVDPRPTGDAIEAFGDGQWGFRFQVRAGLFVQQHPPDSDGTTMILVSAQNDDDVLLTASNSGTSALTAKELMREMMVENSTWKYSHKKAQGDSATLSGFNGDKIFYRKSILQNGRAVGFCIEYPRSLKIKYDDTVEMLASSFAVQ